MRDVKAYGRVSLNSKLDGSVWLNYALLTLRRGKIFGTHWELKGSQSHFEGFVEDNNPLLLSVP